jgi:CheY-like chemotaxis protein
MPGVEGRFLERGGSSLFHAGRARAPVAQRATAQRYYARFRAVKETAGLTIRVVRCQILSPLPCRSVKSCEEPTGTAVACPRTAAMQPDQPILIIDDNVNLAKGFALVLQRKGYRVNVAHTAEEGLRLAQADNPAAVVVDFRMPFINGTGFLYRLRACPRHLRTPVLVVTGAAVTDEMRAEIADLHAELRFKPLGVDELLAEVGALLDNAVRARTGATGADQMAGA